MSARPTIQVLALQPERERWSGRSRFFQATHKERS